jgi:hypothetical protein
MGGAQSRRSSGTVRMHNNPRALERRTVDELRERAKALGVHGYSSMAKAELLAKIRGSTGWGRGRTRS